MLHIDDLTRAVALNTELKQWQEAKARCNPGVFKSATLVVADAAHGHAGQVAQTTIQVPGDQLATFVDTQIARVHGELTALGVKL